MSLPKALDGTLELPVLGSPLFIVSGPELVIAQCKAGIVGSFPALNARPVEVLDQWLTRIEDELGDYKAKNPGKKVAPYAVNQICHASNDRLMKDMETCVKHKVPIIITSLRPPSEIVEAAHSYGGVVFHDVINVKHARKAAEQGVDGLILVCAGAGGHAGTLSPFALVREVKQWFKGLCWYLVQSPTVTGLRRRSRSAQTSLIWARASLRPKKPMPTRPTRRR
jgi:nitronate monooxygenase